MSSREHDLSKVPALRPVVEMHPPWCEWAGTCQDNLGNVEHRAFEMSWPLRADVDDVSVHLALTRHDEISENAPTVQDCGEPTIEITIHETMVLNRDGSPVIAAAHLCLEDAELLLTFLGRHVDRLRRASADVPELEGDSDRKSA